MNTNSPIWGCSYPGCDAHPNNPDNPGPILRTSPKGHVFEGRCAQHLPPEIPVLTKAMP
jgi:hypothetical protein